MIGWLRKLLPQPQIVAVPVPIQIQVPVYVQPLRSVIEECEGDDGETYYQVRIFNAAQGDLPHLQYSASDPEDVLHVASTLKASGGVEYTFQGFTQRDE